ncbi:helix-turn-helix domain-containing protein [Actinomadura harenae]|uniref:Helix-turn-helix domain-containing protein n=1 Tax=Actinomadura harenae TaxID=2483351 RepID=A0A3M2M828_9ACTN|nr:helix-turn-helix domain-containing protein [Actinomadura harenae]RMI44715.1 helix-turn-helix domain-containing protein [Actinomadura harenae]
MVSQGTSPRRASLADSEELAAYLKVPARTLDDWAHRGTGPTYRRVGRHRRYRWEDVERWLDDQAVRGTGE